MSHSDAIAALYDHEQELATESERFAPDWGGDDLFTTTPRRRRFERADQAQPRLVERAHRVERSGPGESPHATERTRLVERPHRAERTRPVESWFADDADIADHLDRPAPDPVADEHAPTAELEPAAPRLERRTVTVTGHPDAAMRTQRAMESRRRRPGPSLDDRIGHRPDRIAAWAFALGLLLILIAVVTANAATL